MKKLFILSLAILLFSCNDKQAEKENKIAQNYYEKAKNDTKGLSFYYFNLAKNAYLDTKDSVGAAKALVNMAILQESKGDYYGSIETSLEADRYLGKRDDSISRQTFASNYNSMAISSSYLYEFENCIKYYKKALQYTSSEEYRYMILNNLGTAQTTLGDYKEAIKNLQLALPTTDSLKYAMVINNLAKVKFLNDKNCNPVHEFYKALEIRKRSNNSVAENSSYATLSNFYFHTDKKMALYFAEQMLNTAKKNKSPEDRLQALQKIINLTPNNPLPYFEDFQKLNDSMQISRNKAKNQFAAIRYDVEKKNLENQSLKLQKAESEIKLLWQYLLSGLLVALLIISIVLYKKRQKKLQQEKEIEIKNTQLKMSKKVHDVVANGLYHMMIDVQNNPEIDKIKILNDMEKMYEESRDISHEDSAEKDFALRFINMITSYSSNEQKVLLVGYKENIWENASYNTQLELYYVLREILVNMKKHSQAKLASVRFEKDNDKLMIRYTDNGIGINNLYQQKGTGIHNTENRIESIKGDITFEKNPSGGLIIQITIPIQSKYV